MDFFLENSNHPSHLISHNTGLETFEEQGNGPVKVERAVGLFGGISLIIGTMIGSGIFASAAAVSKFSGSVGMSLVIWAASGVLAMLGGLCYVELGLMLPESGGEYIYIKEALGDFPAFLNVYVSNIVLKPASFSAICVAAGDYVVEPFLVYEHVASNKVLIAKLIAAFFLSKCLFLLITPTIYFAQPCRIRGQQGVLGNLYLDVCNVQKTSSSRNSRNLRKFISRKLTRFEK